MFENLEKYKSLDFYARQIMEGFITGLHKSPFHGFSVEFAEHRLYNPGESTKNIDWKLFARSDKLFVKRYEEETNLRCQILIDHSKSMLFPIESHNNIHTPNKLTFSIYAAAVITELLLRQRDAFGLTLFGNEIDLQTEVRSSSTHQKYILQLLEKELLQPINHTQSQPEVTHIAQSLHLTAERLKRRSLVVIFTDALVNKEEQEKIFDALRHLRHCKHEVLLFHTYDAKHEIEFNFDNRPSEFIDLESGQKIKLSPNEVADIYKTKMQQQTAEIKQQAIRYNIDYIPVDINAGFEPIILPYLTKRSKQY